MKKILNSLLVLSIILISIIITVPVFAVNSTSTKASANANSSTTKPLSVVTGTVASISGNTLTVTSKKVVNKISTTTTYTVDATKARFLPAQKIISLSDIKVGDNVVVQGVVSGTSISASMILDQSKTVSASTTKPKNQSTYSPGIFEKIGQFFLHLFGR